jgi:hypothetical protein
VLVRATAEAQFDLALGFVRCKSAWISIDPRRVIAWAMLWIGGRAVPLVAAHALVSQ